MTERKPWTSPYTFLELIGIAVAVFLAAMVGGLVLIVIGMMITRF